MLLSCSLSLFLLLLHTFTILLEYAITNHYKAFNSASASAPPLLSLAKSYLQPAFACFSVGSWGPCDVPALPVASIVQ